MINTKNKEKNVAKEEANTIDVTIPKQASAIDLKYGG